MMVDSSEIVRFYSDEDTKPYNLTEIWSKSDCWWESTHDFIQWLFPNREPSKYNDNAPLLTDYVVANLKYPQYAKKIHTSTSLFMDFLGFDTMLYNGFIDCFYANRRYDFTRVILPNHNQLRITRMLKFLKEVNPELLEKTYSSLMCVCQPINPVLKFWKDVYHG